MLAAAASAATAAQHECTIAHAFGGYMLAAPTDMQLASCLATIRIRPNSDVPVFGTALELRHQLDCITDKHLKQTVLKLLVFESLPWINSISQGRTTNI